jgi:RHS repeat-associated protein
VELATSGVTSNAYQFAGEQFDADLGFYFLRTRYLKQLSGRFFTSDTYEGQDATPSSLHKYLYASNNPVAFVDPNGEFSISDFSAASSVQSILAGVGRNMASRALLGAISGASLGGIDSALGGGRDFFDSVRMGALSSAILGPLTLWSRILPALQIAGGVTGIYGAHESFSNDHIAQGLFRTFMAYLSVAKLVPKIYSSVLGPRTVTIENLVPNLQDEFFSKTVGPSNEKLQYHAEYLRKNGKIEGKLVVKDLGNGKYGIQNGHHRWYVAQRFGLTELPVEVVK